MATRLVSVNIGLPRDINWRGKTVHTASGSVQCRAASSSENLTSMVMAKET